MLILVVTTMKQVKLNNKYHRHKLYDDTVASSWFNTRRTKIMLLNCLYKFK